MKRYGSLPALGLTVKLSLDLTTHHLLKQATSKSGRSTSFEVLFRIRDHINRFPRFRTPGYTDTLQKNIVMVRFDDETNMKLIKAKNRSGYCKSYEVRERLRDHLDKFPDFYNTDMVEVIPNNFDSNK